MSNNPQYDPKEFTSNFDLALFAPMGVTWREDSTAGSIIDANMIAIDAELEVLSAGGGTSVRINGATVASPNFNAAAPAPPSGKVAVQWQVSGSSVSGYVDAGFSNPMTAHGDIIYENASLGATALPVGAAGRVLTVVGGEPAWVAPTVYDTLGAAAAALAIAQAYTDSSVAAEASARTTADGLLVPKTTTVNGHALSANVTVAFADIASGTLANGTVATTQGASDNSTKVGTTAYADAAVGVEASARTTADGLLVPKTTTVNGHALSGNVTVAFADIASGALASGTTATTQTAADNSTKVATTAYADAAAPVRTVFGRTGAVVAAANDYTLDQIGASAVTPPTFNFGSLNGDLTFEWAGIKAVQIVNTTAANSGADQDSARLFFDAKVWTGATSSSDSFSLQLQHGLTNAHEPELMFRCPTNNSGQVAGLGIAGSAPRLRFYGSTSGSCTLVPGTTAATLTSSVPINATTGFRIGNAAASGNVLRGNGTNFIAAVLAAADLSNGVTGSGAVVLATAPTVSALTVTGKITSYNAISTVGNGVVSETGLLDVTAKAAALTATTIYTPTATGRYRISIYSQVTVAATSSSILGGATGFVVTYTDGTAAGAAQSVTVAMENSSGSIVTTSATNSTANVLSGVLFLYAKTGVAIQLAVGYTSVGGTPMQYEVHAVCEAM